MLFILEKDGFCCAALEKNDLDLFVEAKSLCFLDKKPEDAEGIDPEMLEKMKAAIHANPQDYWEERFQDPTSVNFVLLKEGYIIGTTDLDLSHEQSLRNAIFCSSHILSAYRGQKLSSLMYEARLAYIRTYTSCNTARLCVNPNNHASIKSAMRNGFIHTGDSIDSDGQPVMVFDISELQAPLITLDPAAPS